MFPMAMVVTIVIICEFNNELDSSDGHVSIGQDDYRYANAEDNGNNDGEWFKDLSLAKASQGVGFLCRLVPASESSLPQKHWRSLPLKNIRVLPPSKASQSSLPLKNITVLPPSKISEASLPQKHWRDSPSKGLESGCRHQEVPDST